MTPLLFILLSTVAIFSDPFTPPPAPPSPSHSQTVQLERGWNLVSWYLKPYDPTPPPLYMDDIFKEWIPTPLPAHYGDYTWFNPFPAGAPAEAGDRVGKFDEPPSVVIPPYIPHLYPLPNYTDWIWYTNQAYMVYVDTAYSAAHTWTYSECDHVVNASYPITPQDKWDQMPMLEPNQAPNYWYFLPYTLRMEINVVNSPTLAALAADPVNPMVLLKSDDGKYRQTPFLGGAGDLVYLEPGKGYFAGFRLPNALRNACLDFVPELGSEPEWIEPQPPNEKESQSSLNALSEQHFKFKAKTHWWYPIEIDSVNFGETPMEAGDEIAVFDGEICVGATAYCDSFPICFAAWKDDIASPGTLDGYLNDHEMTFKWFDVSTNQEITFVPPPTTQAVDDPVAPTHSGFGRGFYAVRNLVNGVASVNQLPVRFKIGPNYPNPFNATTVIPLELPERSKIRIEIFNLKGQRVGNVYESVENAGYPKLYYDASKLSSGVYFCRVSAEGLERSGKFSGVSKLVLLK
jgi:hypothetical protein